MVFDYIWLYRHTVLNRFLWQQPPYLLKTVCVMLWKWEVKKAPINWTILSFVSSHQLNLAKWPQFGPQPHHKTQPFLLADQIANRNSKWRYAMQPQRNQCAWKISKPKPISIHNHVALLSNQPALLDNLKQVTWWAWQSWVPLLPPSSKYFLSHLDRVFYCKVISYTEKIHCIFAIWEPSFPLSFHPMHATNWIQIPWHHSKDPGSTMYVCTQEREKPSAGYSTSKLTVFKFSIHKDYALLSQVTVSSTSVE